MYNSLGLPNVYCTINTELLCLFTLTRYNIVLVLITQLGVSLVD